MPGSLGHLCPHGGGGQSWPLARAPFLPPQLNPHTSTVCAPSALHEHPRSTQPRSESRGDTCCLVQPSHKRPEPSLPPRTHPGHQHRGCSLRPPAGCGTPAGPALLMRLLLVTAGHGEGVPGLRGDRGRGRAPCPWGRAVMEKQPPARCPGKRDSPALGRDGGCPRGQGQHGRGLYAE